MIGIYGNDGDRLPMGYRGLTINDENYPVGIAVVKPTYDAVTEPKATTHGMEAYDSRTLMTLVQIEGVVKADSVAELHDKIDALNTAFDPTLAAETSRVAALPIAPTNPGYLPYTFSVPTQDTENFPSGLMEMQYLGRSMQLPVPRVSKYEGEGARYSIVLQCVDPRRYMADEQSHSCTPILTSLVNAKATYPSWPTLTIEMVGPGNVNFGMDIHDDRYDALRLDLSDRVSGDEVVVDMEHRSIYVNGELDMSLYVSGHYFEIQPGTQTASMNPGTGIATCVLSWHPARV